jgi:hypothetical protein
MYVKLQFRSIYKSKAKGKSQRVAANGLIEFLINKLSGKIKSEVDAANPINLLKGGFFWSIFLCTIFNTASSAAPSDTTVSEDAGIEPRTVATTTASALRRSKPLG